MPSYRKCSDGKIIEVSQEEVAALLDAAEVEWKERVNTKGHDCFDHAVHEVDNKMTLRDYYICGLCGDLLQVG